MSHRDVLSDSFLGDDFFGKYKTYYSDPCKSDLAKLMGMELFYKAQGIHYDMSGLIHDMIEEKVGNCAAYARMTYFLLILKRRMLYSEAAFPSS